MRADGGHAVTALQGENVVVKAGWRLSLTEGDNDRLGQCRPQPPDERDLRGLIERRQGIIEHHNARLVQQQAGNSQSLALAVRKLLIPSDKVGKTITEMSKADVG